MSVCLSALKPSGGTLTPLHVAGSHEQFSVVLFPLSVASEAIGASLSLERRCHLAWRTAAPPGLPATAQPTPPQFALCSSLPSTGPRPGALLVGSAWLSDSRPSAV